MKRINLSVSPKFNFEADPDVRAHRRAYEHMRGQIIEQGMKLLKDDPCAEVEFSIELEEGAWVKTRYLHKITEEFFELRRKFSKLDPYILADRADNSKYLEFRDKFQTTYSLTKENRLLVTERLKTQEDIASGRLGIHGEDEVYDRDRPTPTI